MQSVNTSIHNISVKRSLYGAFLVFSLYGLVILLLLFMLGISWLLSPLFACLLAIAVYGARKAYQQQYLLKLSESGQVEISTNGDLMRGGIANSSFYNSFFLSLHIIKNPNDVTNVSNFKGFSIIVYRDAVTEAEYRLLARLVNLGQE